jgi:hypothetical protein
MGERGAAQRAEHEWIERAQAHAACEMLDGQRRCCYWRSDFLKNCGKLF